MTDVAPHNMTSNSTPSPYVASASGEYPGGYEAYRAFDGTDSIWASDTTTGWIKIDLGAGNTYKIGSYAVKSRLSYTDQMVRDWTLQGSNDNIDWDVLDTVTGETNWGDLEKREFDCDVVTTAYRYFKINITANNGNAFATSISEIYLYLLLVSLPTVTTQAADGIGFDSPSVHATIHGTITDTGGENADERGFDYDYDSGAPYAHDWTETDSYGVAAFSHEVTGLTEGVTVYFRAKAHNSAGWGYGGELSFVTPKAWSKILSEPLGLVDTYSRTWAAHQTYSELLGLADVVSKGVVQHPLTEALGSSDTVVKEPSKMLKESLGLLDVYSRTWSVYRTYTELLGLLDTIAKGVSLPLSEILGLLDTYSKAWSIQRTYTETLGLEDRLSKHPSKALTEVLGLLDSVSYGKNLIILSLIIKKYLQLEEMEAEETNLNELLILKKIVKLLGEM